MKTDLPWILVALLATPMMTVAAAQQTPPPSPAEVRKANSPDVDALIEKLGDESYRVRKAAEKDLLEAGGDARSALERAAKGGRDSEIQWRAQRLLERLEDGGDAARTGQESPLRSRRGDGPDREGRDELDRRLSEVLRRFDSGELRQRAVPFEGMEQEMQEMQRRLEEMQRNLGQMGLQNGGTSSSQGSSITVGPDGVRVEVQETDEAGHPEQKVYEAPDMEAFREQYPDVAKRFLGGWDAGLMNGLSRGFSFDSRGLNPLRSRVLVPGEMPDAGAPLLRRMLEAERLVTPDAAAPPPKGQRLGVYLGALDPAVAKYLRLDDGIGLIVDSVVEDSLASKLDIQPQDVLLEIDDRKLRTAEDVAAALKSIGVGEPVRVDVLRRGGELTLEAKKVEAVEDSSTEESRGQNAESGDESREDDQAPRLRRRK